jgi:hypothetical protein
MKMKMWKTDAEIFDGVTVVDPVVHLVKFIGTAGSLSHVTEGNSRRYWIRTYKLRDVEEAQPARRTRKYASKEVLETLRRLKAEIDKGVGNGDLRDAWVSPPRPLWASPPPREQSWVPTVKQLVVEFVPHSLRMLPLSPISVYAERQLNDREKGAWDKAFEEYPQVSSETTLTEVGFRDIPKPDKSLDDWLHESLKAKKELQAGEDGKALTAGVLSVCCEDGTTILIESDSLHLQKVGIGNGSAMGGLWSLRSLNTLDIDTASLSGDLGRFFRLFSRSVKPKERVFYKEDSYSLGNATSHPNRVWREPPAYPALPAITVSQAGCTTITDHLEVEVTSVCYPAMKWREYHHPLYLPQDYTVVNIPAITLQAFLDSHEPEPREYTGYTEGFHEAGWVILEHQIELRQEQWRAAIQEYEKTRKQFNRIAKRYLPNLVTDNATLHKRMVKRTNRWWMTKAHASLQLRRNTWYLEKSSRLHKHLSLGICPKDAVNIIKVKKFKKGEKHKAIQQQEEMLQQAFRYCRKQGAAAFFESNMELWARWRARSYALLQAGAQGSANSGGWSDTYDGEGAKLQYRGTVADCSAPELEEKPEEEDDGKELAAQVLADYSPWDFIEEPEEDEENPEED